jgi:hypothetical protein
MEIQQKIELADMGLAILTGEVESVEKMMDSLHKEKGGDDDDEESCSQDESEGQQQTKNHPREGRREKKHRGREGKKNSRLLSVRRSVSTSRSSLSASKRLDSFSTMEDDQSLSESSSSSGSDGSMDDSEAEHIARMLQGCEVEYSFPYDFHDELEDALLAQEFASEDDQSYYSGGSSESGEESTVDRREAKGPVRRGRHRQNGGRGCKRRKMKIPTIVAIPTNGHGCVVLRNSGAFSVVGSLPKPMYKELFRKNAPSPEYIAMGTKGRYYIRFEDGSHKCAGPSSLKVFLNKPASQDSAKAKNASRFSRDGINKQRKKKGEVEKRHHPPSIASIAFGRRFDDFFLVRTDGSWECNGDLHRSLDKLLDDRRGRADLEWVALGPNNEWCLKARNERIWWGGVSEEVDDHLSRILIEDEENGTVGDLKFIDFGVNDAFFLLYQ